MNNLNDSKPTRLSKVGSTIPNTIGYDLTLLLLAGLFHVGYPRLWHSRMVPLAAARY